MSFQHWLGSDSWFLWQMWGVHIPCIPPPPGPTGLSLLAAMLGDSLSAKTVCASAKQKASVHYNLHNLYGLMEAKATARYLSILLPGGLGMGWDKIFLRAE